MTPTALKPLRVAVLISGRGSNLQALIERLPPAQPASQGSEASPDPVERDTPPVAIEFVGVLSNRPGAGGLDLARTAGITTAVVDHRAYPSRDAFDQAVHDVLEGWSPDLVVLAGFMRILTPGFVEAWSGRMINVHPSLLPALRGLDTHRRALAAGLAFHGCSIHLVTPELDGGPVLARAIVPIHSGDTPETLAARVQRAEHRLYPAVVASIASCKTAALRGDGIQAATIQADDGTLRCDRSMPDAPKEYWFDEDIQRLVPCTDALRHDVERAYASVHADH